MLNYDMSDCGGQPKYLYLYARIREEILSGAIPGGQRLPSKRNLAEQLNVGVITVGNAYDLLVTEGYLTAKERTGFFVQDLPPEYARAAEKSDPVPSDKMMEPEPPAAESKAYRVSMRLFPAATWNRLMRETLNHDGGLFAAAPYNGLYELRRAIADFLARSRSMQVDPAQVIIASGTDTLHIRLTRVFGHSVVYGVEDPGYKRLADVLSAFGNLTRFIPIDREGLKIDALDESDADVVHVSPANHFPTGVVMTAARRGELLEWAGRSSKRYIIEDDYDSEFRYQGSYIPPLYNADTRGRVIYMNTFSKTLVPSLRISYMILPPALLSRYRAVMQDTPCNVSSFEQATLAHFIDDGYFERHIYRIKTYYRKLRVRVLDALSRSALADISDLIENNAGTHFLLRVHTVLADEEIRRGITERGLPFRLYADYGVYDTDGDLGLIVMNYAAIEPEEADSVIARLASVFPECRR